jgi:signal transduction histidine kinase
MTDTLLRSQLKECRKLNKQLTSDALSAKKKAQKFVQVLIERHEEDRRAISRELHDEVAQLLTGINFELAVLTKEASNSDKKLQKRIAETQSLISKSVEVVHNFARQLRPRVLDDLGIVAAIKTAIKDFTKVSGIPVELKAPKGSIKLESLKKTVIFRVTQEALINVNKHSKATKVQIRMTLDKQRLVLEIEDNGKSFKKNSKNKSFGIGIQGMEERVKMVRGDFKISSNEGAGTTVVITIPLKKDSHNE